MTEHAWHSEQWNQLKQEPDKVWDMVVVGGGITGAGILREASRLGLQVLMVEKRDFSWGTSSRSSKLVHGGLRYLKEGRMLLTRDAVKERERLLNECGDLVTPLPFLIAAYRDRSPGKWSFSVALAIYNLIARQWERIFYPKTEFKMMAPHINRVELESGMRYRDAQTDDSRLVLRLIFEAKREGAITLNYTTASPPQRKDGKIEGLSLRNELNGETCFVRSKMVVNATGIWVNNMRPKVLTRLRPLRGSHLVFPAWRLPVAQAVMMIHPVDGRPLFLLPWEGVTLFGTTDLDHDGDLNQEARISSAEVRYLLEAIAIALPKLDIKQADIIASYAGIRPVISHGENVAPSKESRDHQIWDDQGLLSITGGKLTTFRMMAFDLLKKARPYLPELKLDKSTPLFTVPRPQWPQRTDLTAEVKKRLLGRYGPDAGHVAEAAEEGELERIQGTHTLWVEVRWGARMEGVTRLDDLMLRRVRLGLLLPGGGRDHMQRIAQICEEELGWSDERMAREEQAYLELWKSCYSVPDELENDEPD